MILHVLLRGSAVFGVVFFMKKNIGTYFNKNHKYPDTSFHCKKINTNF